MSRAAIPVATQAFDGRTPSMWVARPFDLAICATSSSTAFFQNGAAADIGGLLDADQNLWRLIARARVKRPPKRVGRELPIGTRQRE